MRVDDGGRTVAAMDVLAPEIGEIIGGSQRYVTGLANVRDAIPFPRTPGNARY